MIRTLITTTRVLSLICDRITFVVTSAACRVRDTALRNRLHGAATAWHSSERMAIAEFLLRVPKTAGAIVLRHPLTPASPSTYRAEVVEDACHPPGCLLH